MNKLKCGMVWHRNGRSARSLGAFSAILCVDSIDEVCEIDDCPALVVMSTRPRQVGAKQWIACTVLTPFGVGVLTQDALELFFTRA